MRNRLSLLLLALSAAACDNGGLGGTPDGALVPADLTSTVDAGIETDQGIPVDLATFADAASPRCDEIRTFETGLAPTREIHVARNGSDTNGDGSAGRPYATIGRGARDAVPGAAIRIHAGTYPGGTFIGPLAGTAQAPIWIGGAPGEMPPVIQGGTEALHFIKVRYLVVHDLVARGATGNGINCDDGGEFANPEASRHIVFRNLDIADIGAGGNEDCLKISGLYDFYVLDSVFARCGGGGSGSAIDDVGCHHGLIARNRFQDLSANAVQAKGGTDDIEIRWNRMQNAGARAVNAGGSTGFQYFRPPLSMGAQNYEARDIRVLANLIAGSEAAVAYVGCVDCVAANNTIVDPTRWVARILQETTTQGGYTFQPARNGRFVNNLVYFNRGQLSTFVNVGPNTDAPSFTFANNLWYAHDDPARSAPSLPVTEMNGVSGMDPLLANPANGDYSIPANSPARGKGMPLRALTGDIAGHCYENPPSIGAFE